MASRLDPEILEVLHKRTKKEISTLRVLISRKKQKHPTLTSNAAAHLIAQENNTSVLQKLDVEDKESLKGISSAVKGITPIEVKTVRRGNSNLDKSRFKLLISYESENYFVKEHIRELTQAYNSKCYTCVFILFRKVIENFVIDILKAKFPNRIDLVFDINRQRYQDFSVVLDNLYKERTSFSHDGKKAIERLNQLVNPFKKDANDKTHSWFHVVKSPSEIDNLQLQPIIELIKILEKEVGIR